MGLRRFVIVLVLLLLVSVCTAQASELEAWETDGIRLEDKVQLGEGLMQVLRSALLQFESIFKAGMRSGLRLLAVVLLCSLLENIKAAGKAEGGMELGRMVGVLAILSLSIADVHTLFGLGRQTLESMELFSKALLPSITAASAAAGAPAGAAVRQLIVVFCSDLLLTLINRLLVPMTFAYIAAGAGYAATANSGLKQIGSSLKWAITTILIGALACFLGYLGMSGLISGAADAMTVKAAKLTMGGIVPVVGGIISDAAETVLAGAAMLRNSIGIFGTVTIIGLCLVPFLRLAVHYLSYKLAAALSATISGSQIGTLIEHLAGAFGLILAMVASSALLLMFSIISALGVVLP